MKPNYAQAHTNLGSALQVKGRLDEAMAAYREAIRLKPDSAGAHTNLGQVLAKKKDVDGAIAAFQEALRVQPNFPEAHKAHQHLGNALGEKGDWEGAIDAYRQAIRLKPDDAATHNNLGAALGKKGDWQEAIAALRKAIALKPDDAATHNNLGAALGKKGDWQEAIAAFRKAIELQPDHAGAHCNLGTALQSMGQFAEALAALQRGHELGSMSKGWTYPSARLVKECQRLVELDGRLPALLKGDAKPADAAERIEFAMLCHYKRLFGHAARFCEEAFAAKPELADDLPSQNRYSAACHAALAGSGEGKDDPPLDGPARARWRQQALDWLRADLALRAKQLASGKPGDRAEVQRKLQHWQRDSDLAGIRDEAKIAKLPEAEREACRRLWADVEALLARARGPGK